MLKHRSSGARAATAVLFLLGVSCTASADASIRAGFASSTLPTGDYAVSDAVNIGFWISFCGPGNHYNELYVNNDGVVTFGGKLSEMGKDIPFILDPNEKNLPIIAPFFADVDTRNGGGTVKYGQGTVDGRPAFGVTWTNVKRFVSSSSDPLVNTFQLVLIDRSSDEPLNVNPFDIEFNYEKIEWDDTPYPIPSAAPGPARVGFSNDDEPSSVDEFDFELPDSGVAGIFLDTGSDPLKRLKNQSWIYPNLNLDNVASPTRVAGTEPGRIVFEVRCEVIPEPSTLLIWSVLGVAGIGVGQWRRRRRRSSG